MEVTLLNCKWYSVHHFDKILTIFIHVSQTTESIPVVCNCNCNCNCYDKQLDMIHTRTRILSSERIRKYLTSNIFYSDTSFGASDCCYLISSSQFSTLNPIQSLDSSRHYACTNCSAMCDFLTCCIWPPIPQPHMASIFSPKERACWYFTQQFS